MPLSRTLRRGVESALATTTVGRLVSHRIRGKRLILAYHGIVPERAKFAGERALFVAQRDFAAHLDLLVEIADVSPLHELDDRGDGRPRVAITFDDAYRGAVNEGVKELVKRRLPATFFVAPGRLNGHVFWWDAVSEANAGLEESIKGRALTTLEGSDEQVRAWAANVGLACAESLPSHAQTASLEELHAAVRNPGITIGSHTWSHANLASLGAAEVADEIVPTRDWLRAQFGAKAIPWLAYPYGLDSPETHRVAQKASYAGGLRIGGGWHYPSEVPPFVRPRLNVPGSLSLAGLRARVLGSLHT